MVIPAVCKKWKAVFVDFVTMAQALVLTVHQPLNVIDGTKSNIQALASRVQGPLIGLRFNSSETEAVLLKVLDTIYSRICSLDFSYVHGINVTDDVLKNVEAHCKNLTELYLSWCWQITDEGLDWGTLKSLRTWI